MSPTTIGELLYWSYANLAMAHAAVTNRATSYGRVHFMIRARLLKGLRDGTMNVGSLVEDERLKMVLPQACSYCGGRDRLSVDHLFASDRGGRDTGDNIVWSCVSCNSSKGVRDLLDWYATRGQFPPLLLLRRYLKLAISYCEGQALLGLPLAEAPDLPFALDAIPKSFPAPAELVLWCVPLA
ncbi:MAG: HNH endonuclease [Gemmataceae bacterium]|nr:HNH endonuclease [Gemmataceae bacterium]